MVVGERIMDNGIRDPIDAEMGFVMSTLPACGTLQVNWSSH